MEIFPLPKVFYANEWFVIVTFILSSCAVLLVRREFPTSILILIYMYSIIMARTADNLLAGSELDLYDIMDTDKYELFDVFTYILYGPFGVFFIYFYRRWHVKGLFTLLYILTWSLIAIGYEQISVYFNIFTFKEWNQFYSFLVYLFVQSLLLLFYHLLITKHPNYQSKSQDV